MPKTPARQARPATSLEVAHFWDTAATTIGTMWAYDKKSVVANKSGIAAEIAELAEELYRAACRKGEFVYNRLLEEGGEQ